ncbi:hypothetical protein [Anthocerotibacter panamensis]|uniref:hypothetical protein n=1 Tax=Anthocerotibacter panamensis TaxID=2857077 RepID=UPI001C406B63|nr:hypothetical protein [Anthocerotibacter panamensis]
MNKRLLVFGGLWLAFVGYAFFLAPPEQPGTGDLIAQLLQGNAKGVNLLVANLFSIMGIMPLLYGCFLIPMDHGRRFPAGLVVGLMEGVGAFALFPYLALRSFKTVAPTSLPWWVKLFDSRWLAFALGMALSVLLFPAVLVGDWSGFVQQWQRERFIHVMTLDFLVLNALLPAMVFYDRKRRGLKESSLFWVAVLVPLFGPLLHLLLRPALKLS